MIVNVSTPPKNRWKPVKYKHVEPDELTKLKNIYDSSTLVAKLLLARLENNRLRARLGLFDDTCAHMIDTIEVSYAKPPRTSIKLDGLEIAHLLAFDPEPKPIPADSDYPINRLTCTFNAKKLIVKGDYDD